MVEIGHPFTGHAKNPNTGLGTASGVHQRMVLGYVKLVFDSDLRGTKLKSSKNMTL